MQIGYRQSVDFDFFSSRTFVPSQLYEQLPLLAGAAIVQQAPNTLTCRVERCGPVQVSFFGTPKLRQVRPPVISHNNELKIASLIDLAGMKAAVVAERAAAKDYIDIDALITNGIGLAAALAAATVIYEDRFNPHIALKALSYFEDGDVWQLPPELKERLANAVQAVELDALPTFEVMSNTLGSPVKDV